MLDVCAAKSVVSVEKIPSLKEAQPGTVFEVLLSGGCQARRSS